MANRHADWLRQAEAAVQGLGGEPWGHSVTVLLGGLSERTAVPAELLDAGKRLDKHYIPTGYPNGFDAGAPTDYYTAAEAKTAIADATSILALCRGSVG